MQFHEKLFAHSKNVLQLLKLTSPARKRKVTFIAGKKTLGGPQIDRSILLLPWFFEEDARSEAFFERVGVKV